MLESLFIFLFVNAKAKEKGKKTNLLSDSTFFSLILLQLHK